MKNSLRSCYDLIRNRSYKKLPAQQKYQIAEHFAHRDARSTVDNFALFEIEDAEHSFEIAKICARETARVADRFENFGIKNSECRFEIAKLCAQTCGETTAKNFKKFGIEGAAEKYEVARLCALDNPSCTASHFHKFKIGNSEHRYEIAKLCLRRKAREGIKRFKVFAIEDELSRCELAKLCAQEEPLATAEFFKNFDIAENSAQERYEIALLCAKADGRIARDFDKFQVGDPERRLEIAKICASLAGASTLKNIKNFSLESERELDVAMLCAQADPSDTLIALQKPVIKDPEERHRLAKLCLKYSDDAHDALVNSGRMFNVKQLDLTPSQNLELLLLWNDQASFDQDPETYKSLWASLISPDSVPESVLELFTKIEFSETNLESITHALETASSSLPCCDSSFADADKNRVLFADLMKRISATKARGNNSTTSLQLVLCKWLRNLIAQPIISTFSADQVQSLGPVIQAIFSYRHPAQRLILNQAVGQLNSAQLEQWQTQLSRRKLEPNQILASLCLFRLDPESRTGLQEYLFPSNVGRTLKSDGAIAAWINACDTLLHEPALSSDQKIDLLSFVRNIDDKGPGKVSFQAITRSLGQLDTVIRLGGGSAALRILHETPCPTLRILLSEVLQTRLGLTQPLDGVRYQEMASKWRHRDAILTYAGRIKRYPHALQGLGQFISSLLDNTWPKHRYDWDTTWAENVSPEFLAAWQENSRFQRSLSEILEASRGTLPDRRSSLSEHYFGQLIIKFKTDRHLGNDEEFKENFLMLDAYLNDGRAESALKLDATETSDMDMKARCSFQSKLIAFAENPAVDTLEIAREAYVNMTNQTGAKYEFGNDLNDWVRKFSTPAEVENYTGWAINLSDDAQDLFLSGTEVDESCQCIYRDTGMNRGLIVSVLDPRLKTLVIKNTDGVIMGRRFVRLVEHEGRSAMLLERQYPSRLEPELEHAMTEHAKRCAEELKCTLIVSMANVEVSAPEEERSDNVTINFGALNNDTYIDSVRGFTNGGEATILAEVHHPVFREGFNLIDRI